MSRYSSARLGLLVAAIVGGGFGCELLAQVDRSHISGSGGSGGSGGGQPSTTTTSASSTTGSSSSTGGSGGAGGSGGMGTSSTTGGTGGSATCMTPSDCPDPGSECLVRSCTQGVCGADPKPAGTLGATQTSGDCQKSQCDGAGKLLKVTDDSDVPVDGVECTDDVCMGGVPSNPAKAASAACGLNGTLFCDGAGKCVGCNAPTDCAGQDTECQSRTCTAGVCGVSNAAQGKVVTAQTAGDCQKAQCDGAGAVEKVADGSDLPVDGETCTQDVCTAGVPSNPAVMVGAACSEGSGILCDGAGKCAACLVATDCAGVDTECQQRSCTAGVCGVVHTALGTPLAAQTSSDCKKAVCDGNGGTTTQSDDTDLPDDNNACTSDVCTAGVPSHANAMNGASCGGALTCLNGTCAGCAQPSDCPGVDDECKARSCTVGVCGFNFTASGFVVAAQTAGDCQKKQCDGAGNIGSVADNTDAPADDGNQCTGDVCTAGAPAHPALAANTACNQGGGSFCSAAGACVQCNAATQCAGTDTECHTRTCSGNTCGANNAAAGTVTTAQTAGDCHKNQCDGAGSIVNNVDGSDLPADDGNQCTSEICTVGVPSHPLLPANTACSQNGGSVCSAPGVCVQCNVGTQCPGTDTDCQVRSCNAGACGFAFTASGTATSSQTSGDCQENQCNGAGGVVVAAKSSDVPADDGNQCTGETCVGTAPTHPNLGAGTACNQGGGTLCNGSGACVGASCSDGQKNGSETAIDCGGGTCPKCALGLTCGANGDCLSGACAGGVCVQCLTGAQCPGSDTECQVRTCNSNTCGVSNTAAGTVTAAQTTGDCQKNQCDGAGNIGSVADNTDAPADDGNQCTTDVCTAGVPSHPAVAVNTACNQGGGSFCSAGGACVQCNAATQCAGTDSECHTRTCNGNTCGASNAAAGTATSAQTTGDCQQSQCDGAGNIVSAADNTDSPADDGNQCTSDVCVAGAPAHPALPADTACSQGGGSFCSLGGVCVQCNSPTQCAGTDTECHTRTCLGNTCGANNATAGTVTSAQTTNDCLKNQCDGAGNIISAADDTDVPVDDGLQCTNEVCTAGVASHPGSAAGSACNQTSGVACNGAGVCTASPVVVSTSPADAAGFVAVTAPIAITFNVGMNPATISVLTSSGPCLGSVQVSTDNFATCLSFSAAAFSAGNTVLTLTPAPGLSYGSTYKIKVTSAALAANTLACTPYVSATGFATGITAGGGVVISQVYGGGGNTGAPFKNDFVELHNNGTTAVVMTSWSVQYAAATSAFGTASLSTTFSGTIQPGGYFLIQGAGGATGAALPVADATGIVNMSGTVGKVALVSNATLLSGTCPVGGAIVDFVGFGATANCFEGAATTAAPSNTTSVSRAGAGCTDANNNALDFSAGAVNPRNTVTSASACGPTALNESNTVLEADYCALVTPNPLSVQTGTSTVAIFGQLFESGITPAAGASAWTAQLGYGPDTVNPENQSGWQWFATSFDVQIGNNDQYTGTFTAPAAGQYRYTYRFSPDGVNWTYCDGNGAGSNVGQTFETTQLPILTVTP